MIRDAISQDSKRIAEIYNHYINCTAVTFEIEPVTSEEIEKRIYQKKEMGLPWLVAMNETDVCGYAYAGKWSPRPAYDRTVELSIYLSPDAAGNGLGSRLFEALFSRLRGTPIRSVIGAIALPNPASIALHEKFGMEKSGELRSAGYKFGQWINVGYWQGFLSHPDDTEIR